MKNVLRILLMSGLAIKTGFAQKIKESEVNTAVTASFQSNFKGAKVKEWEKESEGRYIAKFNQNKIKTYATFTYEGRLMATQQEMKISSLPKKITEYISENYLGYKMRRARIITAPNNKKIFKAEIKKKKEKWFAVFDNDGNFIKLESTEPEEEEKD